ncbi:hypothetical protein [Luteimonas panaciterrae]|uniref:hypothetical protein n=1 Tax=Luteimonas panaciterrae TaxID=363885 RepID=UPI001CFAB7AB|nr:hypothetical protein [Luteimonas panaciterrae]
MIRRLIGFAAVAGGFYLFSQASWEIGAVLLLLGVVLVFDSSRLEFSGGDGGSDGGDGGGGGGD